MIRDEMLIHIIVINLIFIKMRKKNLSPKGEKDEVYEFRIFIILR